MRGRDHDRIDRDGLDADHLRERTPASLAGTPQAQDVLAAEKLALEQAGGQVGHYKIKFDVAAAADKISDNARTAIEDTNTIAYLGEIPQAGSADSLGITNGAGRPPGHPVRHRARADPDHAGGQRRADESTTSR